MRWRHSEDAPHQHHRASVGKIRPLARSARMTPRGVAESLRALADSEATDSLIWGRPLPSAVQQLAYRRLGERSP
jgi:hypothetical protein